MQDFDFNSNVRNTDPDSYVDGRMVGIDKDLIDNLFAEGSGALYTSMTRAFRGINHSNSNPALPANYDLHGYTFFTKPRMKLSDRNCLIDRSLMMLLNEDSLTIPRAIRAFLDPIGSGSVTGFTVPDASIKNMEKYSSPLVDPLFPFITILSNSLVSLTGWPDINVDTFTSEQGVMREQWSMIDGTAKFHGAYDLNATFTNMRGDPLGLLFHVWAMAPALAYSDETWIPWIDSILDNEKDYETRIYRLVMDQTKTFVQKIACTGASFPTATNTGASFNYDANKPLSDQVDTISTSFKCQGAMYYDPYTAIAFNITVVDFNPNMYPTTRKKNYTKIPPQYKKLFKDEGYPWINLSTSELEWYVPNNRYKEVVEAHKKGIDL